MELPIVIFSYRAKDLLEEVTKRTSYFGKMRGSENAPTMLDVMSLTSGEDFLFNEFLEDAVSETYDWLKAFGRKIKHSNICNISATTHKTYKNNGLILNVNQNACEIGKTISVPNVAFNVLEETYGYIELERCNEEGLEWVRNYMEKNGILPHMINHILDTLDIQEKVYIGTKSYFVCIGIYYEKDNGEKVRSALYRDKANDKDGKFAWYGGLFGYFYTDTEWLESGVVITSTFNVDWTVGGTQIKEYTLPMIKMEEKEYFQSLRTQGVALHIDAEFSLGVLEVRGDFATVNSKIMDVYYDYSLIYNIKTELEGYGLTEESVEYTYNNSITAGATNSLGISRYISEFDLFETTGAKHTVKSVDVNILVTNVRPSTIEDINAGDYIEYYKEDDTFDVYTVVSNCTNADWQGHSDLLPSDPRGSITFTLERTSYFDENMIGNVDRNIKEALVNYIIYRWFEYVNVVEADKFYLKFEEYAHKAQLGMNSETKPIQRKYKLF